MNMNSRLGWWKNTGDPPQAGPDALIRAVHQVTRPLYVVAVNGETAAAHTGDVEMGDNRSRADVTADGTRLPLLAFVPPLHPERLGDPEFTEAFGLRYAYVAGAMANGITSVQMVEKIGRAGMLGFFGAAGLPLPQIESTALQLKQRLENDRFGMNLIHSPADAGLEMETVRLYLKHGVRLVSASAYMDLTLPLVYYRVSGIHRGRNGEVVAPNRIVAKVSREEVARKFFSPPPAKLLNRLREQGLITDAEAELSTGVPTADALTAEADSGGHTDNRSALSLLPSMISLRNELAYRHGYGRPPFVGLAGGIATPESAAAAFAMGAAYILTGTVNQACIESGTSDAVRRMLAEAGQADVAMAPAADMFELGIKVQVLKRGTMFPLRAARLYDLYCKHDSWEQIPLSQQKILERDFFRKSFQEEWQDTRSFFLSRDPLQVERAETDAKHRMALVFRSYLGQSSNWANAGDPDRKIDYQIWCGPCIGAFNAWTKGSFLAVPERREVVTVAMNLLTGASVLTRWQGLRQQGVNLPRHFAGFQPRPLADIEQILSV